MKCHLNNRSYKIDLLLEKKHIMDFSNTEFVLNIIRGINNPFKTIKILNILSTESVLLEFYHFKKLIALKITNNSGKKNLKKHYSFHMK